MLAGAAKLFFEKGVGGYVGQRFHNLTTEQARIKTALHELGHMTGATASRHPTNDGLAYNEEIYKKCLK